MKKNLVVVPISLLIVLSFFIGCTKNNQNSSKNLGNNETTGGDVEMKLTSPAFENMKAMPDKYGCRGPNINPPLTVDGIPKNAKTLALIVDDPDGRNWVHWLLWNIPISSEIKENSVPSGAVQGRNDFGKNNYEGPCPPSGTHRYFFKLYALDTTLNLKNGASKSELENAMKGHVLAEAKLIGLYSKK